jgi:hypothetical protein
MARSKVTDKAIASELIRVVQQTYNGPSRDKLTVNYARQEAEESLGLDDGYLKEGDWKAKSKEIIRNAMVNRNPTLTKPRSSCLPDLY